MKKLLFCAAALATMFFTACQQENLEPAQEGTIVTFTVEAPGTLQTKAIADGLNVNQLIYEVYMTGQNPDLSDAYKLYQAETTLRNVTENGVTKNVANVSVDLLQDQKYTVLFWAQVKEEGKDAAYNTADLRSVTYLKSLNENTSTYEEVYAANDESLAAFFASATIADSKPSSESIKLTRPFAQLNLGHYNANTLEYTIDVTASKVIATGVSNVFNVATAQATGDVTMKFAFAKAPSDPSSFPVEFQGETKSYQYIGMNYLFASDNVTVEYDINTVLTNPNATEGHNASVNNTVVSVPLKRNFRTNIIGNLLTSTTDYDIVVDAKFADETLAGGKYGVIDGKQYMKVESVEDFYTAFAGEKKVDIIILSEDVVLDEPAVRSTTKDPTLVIRSGEALSIDLNGKKLSATSAQTGGNYNMFDVRGTLTVMNGTMEYEHLGENMGWGASTNLFNVTAGGVLNLEGVTAKNLGGSDMGFVAHLNNWGEVTLNVENCTLESNYVPVRVFNSGYDMNNVTIKNSTLKGGSAAFWVHNYTVEDFGSAEKAEAQKALLNLSIYDQGNTFSPDVNGVRYGFTNSVRTDAYGITKTVSEDGTVVTLGSLVEDGLVRRGVAGTEGNSTIKEVIVNEGISVLEDRTFYKYKALEKVTLPNSLTSLGVEGGLYTSGNVFQGCTNLKEITIPEGVKVIGKGTFIECKQLTTVNIPKNVTRIEEKTFQTSGLTYIEFHEGVTYFGPMAFRDCDALTEVVIKAPEFTVESNTFLNAAAPFPTMTIYVANAAMKTYLESKLDNHHKTFITVVAPTVPNTGVEADTALKAGEDITLESDLEFSASETTANSGYGATGLTVDGTVLDGNGNTIKVNNAWGTWDCAINPKSGTIKNVTVSGAMRGIFMGSATGDVYIDNVIFDNVIYTFNSDAGDKNYGVYISNSELNGWTSFSNAHKEVVFTNCKFAEGNGYAFCRPYNPCVFENCEFSADMAFDTTQQANILFKNCTYDGVKITAENAASLTEFFYNGVGSVVFE